VKIGDVIRVKNRAKSLDLVRGALSETNRDVPDFLSRSGEEQVPEGIVSRLPGADEISIPVQTQLIVELCSR
jgi:small subunit ribosomal protein S4